MIIPFIPQPRQQRAELAGVIYNISPHDGHLTETMQGTKKALIESRLVTSEMFPHTPKTWKRDRDPVTWWIDRFGHKHWHVCYFYPIG